jgi:hypothetical protein
MGALLRRQTVAAEPDVRFVPARWLVVALGVSRMLLRGGKLGKLGIAGIAWSLLPRKLKLIAIGLVVAASIVVAGSLAAIALLLMQL